MDLMLEAHDLEKKYPVRGTDQVVHALNGVSLAVGPGETLGVVGESGCGKSTLARVLVRLDDPTRGRVVLDGVDLTALRGRRLRAHRRHVQMVFQDPFSSLDPRQPVGAALDEVLTVHGLRRPGRVEELLDLVGLPAEFTARLPHEMSGGQRQRVGIARALAPEPRVLLLDEPVSALDVSVRAEVMNLLAHLRAELGLALVFISHDMAMVRQISDRVAVMYFGRIVEEGGWREVLADPLHPYTAGLRAAVPVPDPTITQPLTPTVVGEVPDPVQPPTGCPFHPRCPHAEDICRAELPRLVEIRPGHRAACHVAAR
ncbi:ABC transporter ATP-binding protein [Pseudonocardia sp. DSM 110487]|uniref:ABC transporter ATP-binding protein n=1 Tax=Pseudonocardia sp. DSM 110487 TaxID=2865833 RepID=UPI001C6A6266|nr:ABC transporter ATP-binding protein [Pseudonocardia sp. DSM 110487]QYN32308.1 ABC transporter ATP-binding protein [Pseudonocardia sp. DSM 110487]